ncbi:MAG: EAL domain-containing protein [Alphaproteobacteria bacterium]|nr:EAL domain-containing protein [Alphaproteobacteria bacterium]
MADGEAVQAARTGSRRALFSVLQRKLFCKIAAAVFLSIVVIEAIILAFSVQTFEREQLLKQERQALGVLQALLSRQNGDMPVLIKQLQEGALAKAGITGVAVAYPDGRVLLTLGEETRLDMNPPAAGAAESMDRMRTSPDRFHVKFTARELKAPYLAAAVIDVSAVPERVEAFIVNVIGLTIIIALFATVVTMTIFSRSVLAPMFRLRDRLEAARDRPADEAIYAIPVQRDDEIGDVFKAFTALGTRLASSLRALQAQRDSLQRQSSSLAGQVRERTAELEETVGALRREIAAREAVQQLPDSSPNPVLQVTPSGEVVYANPAAREMLSDWLLQEPLRVPHSFCNAIDRAIAEKETRDIELIFNEMVLNGSVAPDRNGETARLYLQDVTEALEAQERVDHMSSHDMLTGLPNRTLLLDRLNQAVRQSRRSESKLAVLVIGVEGARTLATARGRDASDRLIQEIARRIEDFSHDYQSAGRTGPEHFGLIVTRYEGPGEIAGVANSLHHALCQPVTSFGDPIDPAVSIGISLFPDDGSTGEALIRDAEIAEAKESETHIAGYRFFEAAMTEVVERQHRIELALRRALKEKDGLFLAYQPKYNLARDRLTGMEVLVRWIDPELGFVSPAEFIPIAERTGLIGSLGDWILHRACSQTADWRKSGLGDLKVAVNLSALQFRDPDLVTKVQSILAESGLDPAALELELTETVVMDDAEATETTLRALRDLGLSLAIDDFGTGYSSLAYLKAFPVQRIKIDKAFIDEINDRGEGGQIAQAVLSLSHSLGMEVTAEGVEHAAQVVALRRNRCDEIQGYLYAKPLKAAEFAAFVEERKRL